MSWSRWPSFSSPSSAWADREPSSRDFMELAQELVLAGRKRPWWSMVLAFVFALAAVGALLALRPSHAPRFVLRVLEPSGDPTALPRARRQLAEYVRDGVLTNDALLGVMEHHDLYATLRRKNPPVALESFREDLEVEVHQNYFLEERTVAEAPRSARLTLSYTSKDPALALAVTRELGRLVVERERRARKAQAEEALRGAEAALERANRALVSRRAEIIRKRAKLRQSGAFDPVAEVELVSLVGSLGWREQELERSHARKAALELGSKLEARKLGLTFEVADAGAVPKADELSTFEVLVTGLLAFAAALPFAMALVGAFAPKRGEP